MIGVVTWLCYLSWIALHEQFLIWLNGVLATYHFFVNNFVLVLVCINFSIGWAIEILKIRWILQILPLACFLRPLRVFYDFKFSNYEDLCLVWVRDTINLKSGVLQISQWQEDFNHITQRQTHPWVWIRLIDLPLEYWQDHQTVFKIASIVSISLNLDDPTHNKIFSHCERILMDMDTLFMYMQLMTESHNLGLIVRS